MSRLLALTGVLVIALVGASTAKADHLLPIPPSTASPVVNNTGGGGVYRTTGATQAAIAVRGYEPLAAPWSPGGTNSIPSTINRMQRAGRILPHLGKIGSFVLTGGAFYVGTKIGDGLGGFIYRKLTGDTYGGATTAGTLSWRAMCESGCDENSIGSTTGTTYPAGWAGGTLGNRFIDAGEEPNPAFVLYYTGRSTATAPTVAETWAITSWQEFAAAYESLSGTGTTYTANTTSTCQADGSGACVYLIRDEDQMENHTETENITEAEHTALPAGNKTTITYAAPGDLGTDADKAASGAVLVAPDGSQTPGQQATEEAICEDLFPGECAREDNIDLPQPEVNETYTDYIARLEALGYIGTATTTQESSALAGYGPEAVTRVRINTTPARVLDPLNWPSVAPAIAPNIALTIRYNPATATPAATEGGTTPGTTTVTGTPTTIPGTPAVDFTPITNLDPGCKFPYGFVCYAVDFTEQFNVTGDAPSFTFDFPEVSVSGNAYGGGGDYTVDLNVMDDYMALWRGILSVVLWVGAIYLVATRMLGVKFGGDPGEAIDDVL